MARNEVELASRPMFTIERLADRLLLSAVLDDGSEVIDEVFVEDVAAEQYVECTDPSLVACEGEMEIQILILECVPMDSELIDPMPEDGGEIRTFGGEEWDDSIIYMTGVVDDEILGDPVETLPDEVLAYTSGMADGNAQQNNAAVELAVAAPEQSSAAPVAGLSDDLLGSDAGLLGGAGSVLG